LKDLKESIETMRKREAFLTNHNKQMLILIEKEEKESNNKVDGLLRKYEKYQEVINTINRKHIQELEREKSELKELKTKFDIELPSNLNMIKIISIFKRIISLDRENNSLQNESHFYSLIFQIRLIYIELQILKKKRQLQAFFQNI
jgi:cysteinyl-tRNA synthetase